MTPEEIKSYCAEEWRTIHAECTTDSMALLQLFSKLAEERKQLQAEKARADKAEEMVAGFRMYLKTITGVCDPEQLIQDSELLAQAHNKRKCDEIVNRILNKSCNDPDVSSVQGYSDAIDIVKSVLGGEG